MASNDSQIDKPQRGCPKIAELLDVNTNMGTQSIKSERALSMIQKPFNNQNNEIFYSVF